MGQIITFYSYKGGVGRSFALANIAYVLATRRKPDGDFYKVLCIDWDLEAPGLPYFFSALNQQPPGVSKDIVDLCLESTQTDLRWQDIVIRCKLENQDAVLHYLPASNESSDYPERLRTLRSTLDALYENRNFAEVLAAWRHEWCENYDFVFVDSRTGLNEIAAVAAIDLADMLVFVFTANNQNLVDGVQVVRRIVKLRREGGRLDDREPKVFPLLSRLDQTAEVETAQEWLVNASRAMQCFMDSWWPSHLDPSYFFAKMKIHYYSLYAYGEQMPTMVESGIDDKTVSCDFHLAASLIVAQMDRADEILNLPKDIRPRRRGERVLLLYERGCPEYCEQMAELADRLRSEGGVDAWIDRYEGEIPNFDRWLWTHVAESQRFVLLGSREGLERLLGVVPRERLDAWLTLSELQEECRLGANWCVVSPRRQGGGSERDEVEWRKVNWYDKEHFLPFNDPNEFKRLVEWCVAPPPSTPAPRPAPTLSTALTNTSD